MQCVKNIKPKEKKSTLKCSEEILDNARFIHVKRITRMRTMTADLATIRTERRKASLVYSMSSEHT